MRRAYLAILLVSVSIVMYFAGESRRADAQSAESAANARFEVVVISEHELFPSEQRLAQRIVAALARRGLPATLTPPGDRGPSIRAFMSETTLSARTARITPSLLGRAPGVLFVRLAAPDGRISGGVDGFSVVLAGPVRELMWSEGGRLPEDALPMIAQLVRESR